MTVRLPRLAALALAVAACWAQAAPPGSPDELLITSNRNGSVFEVYRMSADGRRVARLVPERGEAGEMSWSPDGSQVLYTASRPGQAQNVFVASALDGSTRQLTRDSLPCAEPTWSPDGRTIAFSSSRDGARRLYLMDADGGHVRRLTTATDDDERGPRFSPDGTQIAYIASRDGFVAPRIAVADLRTGKSAIVSTYSERAMESPPSWSPDGRSLLFTVIKGSNASIFTMNADGSGRRLLRQAEERDALPQWSPDGRQVMYLSISRDTRHQGLHVMNADGTAARRLVGSPSFDVLDARWSSDGQRIYFVQQIAAGGKVFSTDLSGQDIRRLSGDEGFDLGLDVCCSRAATRTAAKP